MIIIKNNTESQVVYIEKAEVFDVSAGTLTLKNNTDKREYAFEVADDCSSRLFYKVDITLPEGINDGEYTFSLSSDGHVASVGLVQIGDYVPEKHQYTTTENNHYKQYEG